MNLTSMEQNFKYQPEQLHKKVRNKQLLFKDSQLSSEIDLV